MKFIRLLILRLRPSELTGLLWVYRLSVGLGLWSHRYFIAIFRFSYWIYKFITDRNTLKFIKKNINDGDYVIDVGAMIGFYTYQLALNVGKSGYVYAFEPEKRNYTMLIEALKKKGLETRASMINSAVSSTSGTINLAINNDNPADHHIALNSDKNTQKISSISLDEFLKI